MSVTSRGLSTPFTSDKPERGLAMVILSLNSNVCLESPLVATQHRSCIFSPELLAFCDTDLETKFGNCDICFLRFNV